MQSAAFDKFMGELCDTQGVLLRDCFAKSFCVSADVTAAYDPNFAEVYDKRNCRVHQLRRGPVQVHRRQAASPARPTPAPRWWASCAAC